MDSRAIGLTITCTAMMFFFLQSAPAQSVQKIFASDGQAGDAFGRVSVDDGTLVVGAIGDDTQGDGAGSAYIFEWDETNGWIEAKRLLASNGFAGNRFGRAVSISGSFALIGADQQGGSSSRGTSYLFYDDPFAGWTQLTILSDPDMSSTARFGHALSLDGDVAIVGAFNDGDSFTGPRGSAFVFERNTSGAWPQTKRIRGSDGNQGADFGQAVSVSGDYALVGKRNANEQGESSGMAHIFVNDPVFSWLEIAKLLPTDVQPGDWFGWSVSIDGDHAFVGAYQADAAGANSGAVYTYFNHPQAGWTQTQKLIPADLEAGDGLGSWVSVDGDYALLTSPFDDDGGENVGAAYIYVFAGVEGWLELAKLTPQDGTADQQFAFRTSLDGTIAAIGALGDDDVDVDAGAVYVYDLSLLPPRTIAPHNGAAGLATTVRFEWSQSPAALSYTLEVSENVLFTPLLLSEPGIAATSFQAVMPSDATLFWRVRAENLGGAGDWTKPSTFNITGVPAAPITLEPEEGATDVPLSTVMRWSSVENTLSYSLQVSRSPAFSPLLVDESGLSDTTTTVVSLDPARVHYWRVRGANATGEGEWSETSFFTTTASGVGVEDDLLPTEYALSQNYPNPFNPSTTISYELPRLAEATLTVYNVLGRTVRELASGTQPAGEYEVSFDAGGLPSGVYFYRLQAGDYVETRRMVVVK